MSDDTATIQGMVDATPEGGECRIPVGRYRVSKTIRLNKTLALIGEGVAYAQFLGYFGDPSYAAPGYSWGTVIESTVSDGPTIEHAPGRYTGLRIEHLTLTGIGDATRTGAGIRISAPGMACEAGISNVQISNFKVGLDAECLMTSTLDRVRVNGCDTGIYLRTNSNANLITGLAASGCGDAVVFDGAGKNTLLGGAIQGSTRTGVSLRNHAEENTLRDIYFEAATQALAIDAQPGCDATVVDSCHFGTTGDSVRIAANGCRVFAAKYQQGLTLTGIGTQVVGPWHGPITDAGNTLLIADNASYGITLPGTASLEFRDGRRWTPGGQVHNQTLYWVDPSGKMTAALWAQGDEFWCQTPGNTQPGRGGINGNPPPRVTRLSKP